MAIVTVLGEIQRSDKVDKKVVDIQNVKDADGNTLEDRLSQLHFDYAQNDDINEIFDEA